MMDFKVESGVPFASNRGGRGRKPTAFPLHEMHVGDSFLIACDTKDKKVVDSWRRKLLVAKKRFNDALFADTSYGGDEWAFRTSTTNEGIRVWRTE
jgi:hypothetical protein